MVDTRGDAFAITVDGRHHAKRVDAGEHLIDLVTQRLKAADAALGQPIEIGQLAGLDVQVRGGGLRGEEICLLIPDASIERRYIRTAWPDLDPAQLVQAL